MATSTGERYPKRYPKITTGCANTSVAFPSDLAAGHERLLDKIEALWGSREAIAYLDSLMLTDRRGRKGFTERVLRNLVSVRQLHETLYPAYGGNPHDPFSAATADVARLDFDARRAAAAESARRGRGGDARPPVRAGLVGGERCSPGNRNGCSPPIGKPSRESSRWWPLPHNRGYRSAAYAARCQPTQDLPSMSPRKCMFMHRYPTGPGFGLSEVSSQARTRCYRATNRHPAFFRSGLSSGGESALFRGDHGCQFSAFDRRGRRRKLYRRGGQRC